MPHHKTLSIEPSDLPFDASWDISHGVEPVKGNVHFGNTPEAPSQTTIHLSDPKLANAFHALLCQFCPASGECSQIQDGHCTAIAESHINTLAHMPRSCVGMLVKRAGIKPQYIY